MRLRAVVGVKLRYLIPSLCTFALLASPRAFAEFEQTTDTKTSDEQFTGGYTKDEVMQMKMTKEQKSVLEKFTKGRYSSAVDGSSRYSGIMEYHDNNFDGITEHDGASNAAESSGDKIGLGKTGLAGVARRRAMITERINSSGNCELSKDEQKAMAKDKNFFDVKGVLKGSPLNEEKLLTEIMGNSWKDKIVIDPATQRVSRKDFPGDGPIVDQQKKEADAALELYRKEKRRLRYIEERDDQGKFIGYRMQCPNVSAIVLDRGSAHGAETGAGHRVYELNEKTFTAGQGADGPFGQSASGAVKDVADKYVAQVKSDSAQTAIPQEIRAAMKQRGMDVWTSKDGKKVFTQMPDGSVREDAVGASIDDMKSEFAWLEQQKKHRLNETWKSLRAERFLTGDDYDPANVSSEIGSLLAKYADKDEKERDKMVAEKVAEHNVYSNEAVCLKIEESLDLGPPIDCSKMTDITRVPAGTFQGAKTKKDICGDDPAQKDKCYLSAYPRDLRDNRISAAARINANELSQRALDAAKSAVAGDKDRSAQMAKNKERLKQRVQECMARDKWCEQVDLSSISYVKTEQELKDALADRKDLQNRGITLDDAKAGMAYLETKGDPGNAFKDTREFISARMETAMEGGLKNFVNNVRSADFNESTDAKTKDKPFAQMKKQWEINMKIAKDVLEYSENAYQMCIGAGGDNCKRQFDASNFDPSKMNTVQLFGRMEGRNDGKTLGTAPTRIGGELTRPETSLTSPGALGMPPRQPSSQPLPARGSAPAAPASPFSLN